MILLVYAVVYLILISLLLGAGVAAGWLLHEWVPDIDRNTATLAGVVAAVAALHFAVRLFGQAEDLKAGLDLTISSTKSFCRWPAFRPHP